MTLRVLGLVALAYIMCFLEETHAADSPKCKELVCDTKKGPLLECVELLTKEQQERLNAVFARKSKVCSRDFRGTLIAAACKSEIGVYRIVKEFEKEDARRYDGKVYNAIKDKEEKKRNAKEYDHFRKFRACVDKKIRPVCS